MSTPCAHDHNPQQGSMVVATPWDEGEASYGRYCGGANPCSPDGPGPFSQGDRCRRTTLTARCAGTFPAGGPTTRICSRNTRAERTRR